VVFVVEADTDKLLRPGNRSVNVNVGSFKEKRLNSAGRTFQLAQLMFEQRQSIFNLEGFFNGESDSREFQQIITNGLRDIEARITEDTSETDDPGGVFTGKIHEFHG
jgi:hypothetical protein